jgi:hypothetical protein
MNVDTDRLIQVVHYHNKPNKRYGIPFRFVAIKVTQIFSLSKKENSFFILRESHLNKQRKDYKNEQV